jgi:hypothetical protein
MSARLSFRLNCVSDAGFTPISWQNIESDSPQGQVIKAAKPNQDRNEAAAITDLAPMP